VIALGTNNYDFSAYRRTLLQAIQLCRQNGQIPVLVTVTPTPHNAAFRPLANEFVRSSGEKFVDICSAVTVPGDERTWKEELVLDGVHPNVAGHRAIFERFLLDAPELVGKRVKSEELRVKS
jgi:lysophospholipase L1-like esterase